MAGWLPRPNSRGSFCRCHKSVTKRTVPAHHLDLEFILARSSLFRPCRACTGLGLAQSGSRGPHLPPCAPPPPLCVSLSRILTRSDNCSPIATDRHRSSPGDLSSRAPSRSRRAASRKRWLIKRLSEKGKATSPYDVVPLLGPDLADGSAGGWQVLPVQSACPLRNP